MMMNKMPKKNEEEDLDLPSQMEQDAIQEDAMPTMPQMAGGGMVDDDMRLDDPYSVAGGASATAKSPPLPPPPPPPPAPPMAPPVAAPTPSMAPPAPPVARKPLPGMPPEVTPEDLKNYLGKQRASLGKYDPDEQFKMEQGLINRRGSIGNRLAMGAATFAGPEYAKQLDDRWNNDINMRSNTFSNARDNTSKKMEAEQGIDSQDPTSTMSKLYQNQFGTIFTQMGYKPTDIEKMSASKIGTIAQLAIQYEDAKVQQELKRAMLGIQGMTAKANVINQVSQRNKDSADTKRNAASEILKRSGNSRILGIPIPFTSDVSGKEADAARKVLSDQLETGLDPTEVAGAEDWLAKNPNDPRAPEIRKRIGK